MPNVANGQFLGVEIELTRNKLTRASAPHSLRSLCDVSHLQNSDDSCADGDEDDDDDDGNG